MRHLIANRFGQRLVERQNISGGIAEIAVSAVNCLGDGFIDLIVFSQRIFNRNFLAVSLARYEFRTNSGVARIGEIVLLVR